MRARLSLMAVAALAAAAVVTGPASGRHTASFQINVTAKEFSFHLGRGGVPHGTRVVFHVINNGKLPHDFKINGKKTPLIQPKQETTMVVRFPKKGKFSYLCTVPGHAAAGMKGIFRVF
jgi:uncharacterized cupredoxin-like copper-binding protein